jgi:hypothetical protein
MAAACVAASRRFDVAELDPREAAMYREAFARHARGRSKASSPRGDPGPHRIAS